MKKIALDENMTRGTWLAMRKRGIGGSDASVVCGINSYKCAIELWMEKTGQLENDEDSEAAYWGRMMEPVIRQEFSRRSGLPVQIVPYMLQHDQYPFMLANLDGEIDDPWYGKCVFEAKTSSAYRAEEWEPEIPREYYLQIQHYMAVTGYKGTYIAALIGGNHFIWKFIERNEEVIDQLIESENRFWEYVRTGTVPPIDGSEASEKFLARFYSKAQADTSIQLAEESVHWIATYQQAAQEEAEAQGKKTLAANHLKEQMKEHEAGVIGDRKVIWKNVVSERFDTKTFKEQFPEGYRKYICRSEHRRFSVK